MIRSALHALLDRLGPLAVGDDLLVPDAAMGALLRDDTVPESVADALPDESSEWPLPRRTSAFLARLVVAGERRRALEFGAGSSSIMIARALADLGGGMLTSLESHPEWCAERWKEVEQFDTVDARLVASAIRLRLYRNGPAYEYEAAPAALAERGPFDLVVVDAPQSWYGRDGALETARDHMAEGAVIVLDDAGRQGEREAISGWLRSIPGLSLAAYDPTYGRHGIAVLRFGGDHRVRWSGATLVRRTVGMLRNARARRRLGA